MREKHPSSPEFRIHWRDHGLWRNKRDLAAFLQRPMRISSPLLSGGRPICWIGWGRRKSGRRAEELARRRDGDGFLLLEDGFLRSFGLGRTGARALSIIIDDVGVHYDATCPSRMEMLLQDGDFDERELRAAERIIAVLGNNALSKFNTGLSIPRDAFPPDEERVLVVDQTSGDASITYGLASQKTFKDMLEAALEENPHARIYVKTHPDVLAGKRQGCIPQRTHPRISWITDNWRPHDLLRRFQKVYVVTSLMGLDALILDREVHCFGMPFYAGWGATRDRQRCARRTQRRTPAEIVAAAYLRQAKYLNPETDEAGDFFSAAAHITRQKRQLRFWEDTPGASFGGRVFAFGFQFWKKRMMAPFFGDGLEIRFVRSIKSARRQGITARDRIAVWGIRDPAGLSALAQELGLTPVRVEDGFVRSAGLGADFVPPRSLVFDPRGIYFDATRESLLERLLNTSELPPELLERARRLRRFIVENRLTKYNLPEDHTPLHLPREAKGKRIVLAPGQVESDASIAFGCGAMRTNLELLETVRRLEPNAFLIYKPHPDVLSGNRRGRLHLKKALEYCDMVERRAGVVSCLEKVDAVHVMTSLTGFDALLRDREVHCHGLPFYAGWGLTRDHVRPERRERRRNLDELVAIALLLYPVYSDGRDLIRPERSMEMLAREREMNRKPLSLPMRKLQKLKNLLKLMGAPGNPHPPFLQRNATKRG